MITKPSISICSKTTCTGFSLIEMLLALLISGVSFIAAINFFISYVRSSSSSIWGIQLERSFSRLHNLLAAEANEACTMETMANPITCTPPIACSTVSANQLRLMIPVLDNDGVLSHRMIRYYLNISTGQLLRDGPRILPSGTLDMDNPNQDNMLLMEDVTTFAVTLADDCRSATLQVTSITANTGASRSQSIGLRTGAKRFKD